MRSILIALLVGLAVPAFAADPLTNDDVIAMIDLGLGPQVIKAKIETSPNQFDTSPTALAALEDAGVSGALISAMIKASSAGHNAEVVGDFFKFASADGVARMDPVRVISERSRRKRWIPIYGAFAKPETFMFLAGRHAALTTASKPSFITTYDPLGIRLVHLGQHESRESRFVVFAGNTSDREVRFHTEKLNNGTYELTPLEPLLTGKEYAFLVAPELPQGMVFWTWMARYGSTSRAFDFQVRDGQVPARSP